jgi:fumarate hydratase subunit beta
MENDMQVKILNEPVTKEKLVSLRAGDVVELSAVIYTARDAAHKRFQNAVDECKTLPLDLTNKIIFYAGPAPAKNGQIIGSIAPTTSARMDNFLEMTYKLGCSATIGKGERNEAVPFLCKQYGRVYFLSFGGAAALISSCVKECNVVAYSDLGAESIKELRVEKMRLIVGIDAGGNVFETEEIKKYKIYKKDVK